MKGNAISIYFVNLVHAVSVADTQHFSIDCMLLEKLGIIIMVYIWTIFE